MNISKLKITKIRKFILDLFETESNPISAEDIFIIAKPIFTKLALTTIYRNLDILSERGLIHKIMFPDGVSRYEKAKLHTHHLICLSCHKTFKLGECPIEKLTEEVSSTTGFYITAHNLELFGLCSRCK